MLKRSLLACATATVALVCASGTAVAQDSRVLSDKWYVTVGGYLVQLSTDAQVGTGSIIGTAIRAEDQLGLDDQKSTFRLSAERRFGKHHILDIEYFSIKRSGATVLSETIEFQGTTYEVGASLSSEFKTQLFQAQYRYAFVNDGKTEAGIQAGLSTWDLSASLEGEATVTSVTRGTITEFAAVGEDILAPVPSFGLYVRHAITPRLVFSASAGFFRVRLGDIEGRMVNTNLALDYFFSRHVGIGAGFNGTDMKYKDSGTDPLSFEYQQNGLVAYLSMAF